MSEFTNGQLTKIVKGFQELIDRQGREIEALKLQAELQANSLRRCFAELENTKQMTAHVMGRGMGSTVHRD